MERAGARPRRTDGDGAPGAAGLIALLVSGAALGGALWAFAGAPALPDGERLLRALGGAELSDSDIAAGAAAAAWLLLGYLALSVALRLMALLAARSSGGAAWARAGLRLSTLVTIPAVRRLVDSGVGGALLAASWLPLAPGAPPGQYPVHAEAAAAPAVREAPAAAPASGAAGAEREPAPQLRYTVAAGEDLWGIARSCYGDGARYVEIFAANEGRLMATGERFTDPRLVRPGWEISLTAPLSGASIDAGVLRYRVRAGDHLWGIAERWLGDGFRWVEIWERNRGRDMGGGRHFTDPGVIAPGWVLELPLAEPDVGAAPAPDGVAADAPPREGDVPGAVLPGSGGAVPAERGAQTRSGWVEWPQRPHTALLSAAGVAVLGGAALFVGRRRRSGSGLTGEPGDAGRVALAAGALQAAFSEAGFPHARPVLLREGGRHTAVVVACAPGEEKALAALRYDLARRLGCDVGAAVERPARVVLTLPRAGRPPGLVGTGPAARAALAVPAGATADEVVYLNLEAAGSVTVTGEAEEQRALLRSWLRTLSTLRPPEALSLRADARAADLLREEPALPHFAGGGVSEPEELASELEEFLSSRGGQPGRPLVAIFALDRADADLPEAAMREGPRAGVYVIRCLPPGAPDEVPAPFGCAVSFGGTGGEDEGDGSARPAGGIALRLGRERPLYLEPVLVRRDASPRWSESAELAGVRDSACPPPGAPPGTAGDEEHGAGALPRPRVAVDPVAGDDGDASDSCAPASERLPEWLGENDDDGRAASAGRVPDPGAAADPAASTGPVDARPAGAEVGSGDHVAAGLPQVRDVPAVRGRSLGEAAAPTVAEDVPSGAPHPPAAWRCSTLLTGRATDR